MPDATCSIDGCDRTQVARGFCHPHWRRWRKTATPDEMRKPTLIERFWRHVDKAGPLPKWAPFLGPCWLWTGSTKEAGYGQFNAEKRNVRAHRFAYELVVGPIPAGLELDHLCMVTGCVNPAHLEAVTKAENLRRAGGWAGVNARKTKCDNGHPFDEDNTYVDGKGRRSCRACHRANESRRQRQHRLPGGEG